MSKIYTAFRLLHEPYKFIGQIVQRCSKYIRNDVWYISVLFRCKMGYSLNLDNPKTFQEKLQWLKLYDRNPKYTNLVNKYSVKDYVSDIIGAQYVIQTLGVWDSAEDIDWERLPDEFVLKTTHDGGGGGIIICRDRFAFDKEKAICKLKKSLNRDVYWDLREWPYKNVSRKIIAEPLLKDPKKNDLQDYKFFCFNGKVKFFKIDYGRFVDHHANYYDRDANLLPFGELRMPPVEGHVELIPDNLDEMIRLAEKLSQGMSFVRVDLYNVNSSIYFGELTFYPASGFGPFTSKEWEYRVGEYLVLPTIR